MAYMPASFLLTLDSFLALLEPSDFGGMALAVSDSAVPLRLACEVNLDSYCVHLSHGQSLPDKVEP